MLPAHTCLRNGMSCISIRKTTIGNVEETPRQNRRLVSSDERAYDGSNSRGLLDFRDAVTARFDLVPSRDEMNAQFGEVHTRLGGVELRLHGVESHLDRVERRLLNLETRVDEGFKSFRR